MGALAAAMLVAGCGPQKTPEQLAAEREDAAFEAAIQAASVQARAKLPYFWEHKRAYDAAPTHDAIEYDFMLRVAFDRKDGVKGVERIWIEAVGEQGDGRYSGFVATPPQHQGPLKRDDRIEFRERQIVDWAFVQGAGLVGHYTTRVELPRMDPEQAGNLRASLKENPP